LIIPGRNGLLKRKFYARKLMHESVDFVNQNALQLTTEKGNFKKFFGAYTRPRKQGHGKKRSGIK
jgi:hypothetical protein